MYSYFIVNDKIGEIVSINPVGKRNQIGRLDLTIERFEQILGTKIDHDGERFSAAASFYFLRPAKVNNQYFIGEAAGFQDCLAGFGMMYAFKSGYFAAKSIIEGLDYDRLWQEDFLKPMEISVANRQVFQKLSNRGYETLVDILSSKNVVVCKLLGGNDLRSILKKVYNYHIPQPLRKLLLAHQNSFQ
jgi:flavin-dependent dehydrogenase